MAFEVGFDLGLSSAMPDRTTGARSGNSATSERLPPIASTVFRRVDSKGSLRFSRRETLSWVTPRCRPEDPPTSASRSARRPGIDLLIERRSFAGPARGAIEAGESAGIAQRLGVPGAESLAV